MNRRNIIRGIMHIPLFCAVLAFSLVALFGCSGCSTKPEEGSLRGSVELVDTGDASAYIPSDNSGVAVALYATTELDTTIVRINGQYPQAGFILDQQTEFDHRTAELVSHTVSDAQGVYNLHDVPVGVYTLVFLREGYDVTYLHNVSIRNQEITVIENQQICNTHDIAGYYSSDFTFESGRSYMVTDDVYFTAETNIEPGARIYVNPSMSIKFYGIVTSQDISQSVDPWHIASSTSLYQINSVPVDSMGYFSNLVLYANNSILQGGVIRYIRDGIAVLSHNNTIGYIDLSHAGSGITFNNVPGKIRNMNFRYIASTAVQGLSLVDSLEVSKCIIYKATDGIIPNVGGGFVIEDNYLIGNEHAVYPHDCNGIIQHNVFESNIYDIRQMLASCIISYNEFMSNKYTCIIPRRYALVNNNNFYSTARYFINIRGTSGSNWTFVNEDLDAKQNYWGVQDIDLYLLDATDNPDFPNAECPHYILYLPKRTYPVQNAGIRPM